MNYHRPWACRAQILLGLLASTVLVRAQVAPPPPTPAPATTATTTTTTTTAASGEVVKMEQMDVNSVPLEQQIMPTARPFSSVYGFEDDILSVPRNVTIVLAWTSPEMHSILASWKAKCQATNNWSPLTMIPPAQDFIAVDSRTVNVHAPKK